MYFEVEHKTKECVIIEINEPVVEIDGSIFKINLQKITDHLHILKNNLIALNKRTKKLNNTGITMLNNALNATSDDINKFKSDNNFSDIKLQFGSHQDHNILGNKLYNDGALRSDIDDLEYEKLKMLNTIMDIEIMILMLKNNQFEGRIKLTNLHNLIRISSALVSGRDYLTYDDIFNDFGVKTLVGFTIDDENTYNNFYTNDFGVKTRVMQQKVHKIDKSQDVDRGFGTLHFDAEIFANDAMAPIYEGYTHKTRVAKDELSPSYNTQLLGDSGMTYVIKRDIIPSYIPFVDINKTIFRNKAAKAHLIDSAARQSLRDDYKL